VRYTDGSGCVDGLSVIDQWAAGALRQNHSVRGAPWNRGWLRYWSHFESTVRNTKCTSRASQARSTG